MVRTLEHRFSVIELKLEALQYYFEYLELEEENMAASVGLEYVPDKNLQNLLKILSTLSESLG